MLSIVLIVHHIFFTFLNVLFFVSFTAMTEEITGNWSYYVYISLTLVPVYLAFQLIKFLGWQLFVNNWANNQQQTKETAINRQQATNNQITRRRSWSCSHNHNFGIEIWSCSCRCSCSWSWSWIRSCSCSLGWSCCSKRCVVISRQSLLSVEQQSSRVPSWVAGK